MARYYVTIADSVTQAADAFAALQTSPDGSTIQNIKVPMGATRISVVGTCLSPDVISVIDTGNNFTLQFSGAGMVDGIQELHAGSLTNQETGTSVTGDLVISPPHYRDTNLRVKAGDVISVAAAYSGTDGGSPFIAVTLGFD